MSMNHYKIYLQLKTVSLMFIFGTCDLITSIVHDLYPHFMRWTEFSTYRRTLTADKVQNSEERTRFHIMAYNDIITYYDLQLYDFLLNEVSDGFRVRKNARPWLYVFLIVSYEPITMNTVKKHNQSMFHTSVKLDGSTIYNGLEILIIRICQN
jgi:hypothetical protein